MTYSKQRVRELLINARSIYGWSQRELCRLLDVASDAVHGWEAGTREPRPENIRRLADVLGINHDALDSYLRGESKNPLGLNPQQIALGVALTSRDNLPMYVSVLAQSWNQVASVMESYGF